MLATDQAATRPLRMISATLQTSLGLGLRYGRIGGMALCAKAMATKIPLVEATAACIGFANGNMAAKASDSVSDNLHWLMEGSFSFHDQVCKDCLSWNGLSEINVMLDQI